MPNFVVTHKVIDDNKYVASDILIAILSNSERGQSIFNSLHGMEILIECISVYQEKLPEHTDEKEYLSNLFDCLNILLINNTAEVKKSKEVYYEMNGN
jgi:hypothetical protein